MYNLEWRKTSAGWNMPYVDGDEVGTEVVKYVERCNELEKALRSVGPAVQALNEYVSAYGKCDHIVGDCICEDRRALEQASDALKTIGIELGE